MCSICGCSYAISLPSPPQVVSRDGTLFNKAGLITGGASVANDARAQRWNDGALSKCKEQRSELEQRLLVC